MRLNFKYILLILSFIAFLNISCSDESDETMSWRPGTGLHIVGSSSLGVGEEAEYYVDGFTIKETYTWTLDGAAITPIREGEFVNLTFDEPGTHTLTVSNGKYSGSMDIEVE